MSRRVVLALVGAVLWLGGVEVMPNLHLALHDSLAPHVHQGDTTIYEGGHEHRVVRGRNARQHDLALRLEHGAHSLAHHGLAMQPAPPPVLAPLPVDRHATVVPQVAIIEPRSHRLVVAVARGPPRPFVRS
ncbi:MAG: hypothetical protein ABI591_00960 [Kofleriaceae bacterium]